ncbi:hypothetical protein D6201_03625 [Aurantiacibacter aquimixticola]|uniref:Uncharacterized protein n=1 Tax=Aurantiacibacter aquimixticola TaxID=1958945 RepID=A0A419RRZ2_9SPHN|nr:hypothetical protein D6201_03625 [Aurantiacibacter aquimixticola]
MLFAGETTSEPEWLIGISQESETRFMIARLSQDILAYDIRIGWAETMSDGSNVFTETSSGTCRINGSENGPAGNPK